MCKGTYGHKAVRASLYTAIPVLFGVGFFAWSRVNIVQGKNTTIQHPPVHIQSTGKVREPKALSTSMEPAEPHTLFIPKLKLTAAIEKAGVDEKGEMAMPSGRDVASWFKQGYLPGAPGNSVLAGHSKHTLGKGAFYDIHTLATGDEIEISTATRVMTFKVTHAKTIHADTRDLDEVFGPSPKARLNLITCTGAWNASKKRFEDRLIIFSEFDHERIKGLER